MPNWPHRNIHEVRGVGELVKALSSKTLARYQSMTWRGVANKEWELDSGLARRLIRTQCDDVRERLTEAMVASAEQELLADARRLRVDRDEHGRLTDLELLAVLQHQGAATRLLDVTTNALLAAWFAVEDIAHDEEDGFVFGIDMTDSEAPANQAGATMPDVLDEHVWLWRPPPVDPRIRAQQGAFIFSAVPPVVKNSKVDRALTTLNLEVTSFNASRLFQSSPGSGRYPTSPVVIFQIPAASKAGIRAFLTGPLGYTPDVIYPDLAGFARARRA